MHEFSIFIVLFFDAYKMVSLFVCFLILPSSVVLKLQFRFCVFWDKMLRVSVCGWSCKNADVLVKIYIVVGFLYVIWWIKWFCVCCWSSESVPWRSSVLVYSYKKKCLLVASILSFVFFLIYKSWLELNIIAFVLNI